jgi:hypothetical protein
MLITASAIAPAAGAQDDWRREIRRLQEQLDAQARTIEQQQGQIVEQARQIDALRQSIRREQVDDGRAADLIAESIVGTGAIEPAELRAAPIGVPTDTWTPASGEAPSLDRAATRSSADTRTTSSAQTAGPRFGYANGFFIASPESGTAPGDAPFLLRINSRLQMRYTAFDSDGPTADENDIEFERVRLVFSGFAYSPDLAYVIQLDGDSDERVRVDLLDYFVTYDFGHAICDCDAGALAVKAGKYRVPFHRARQDAAWMLQFADRATSSEFFDIIRGIGVGLGGTTRVLDRPVTWDTAVFNGFRVDTFALGRVGELDRNLAYSARVTAELAGAWGTDGEPDLSWHECPAVKIGAGVAFTRVDRDDGSIEFLSVPAFADSGMNPLVSDVVPAAVDEFGVHLYALDANFKYHGFTLLSEYYFRHLTEFAGAPVDDRFDHGFVLQTGYFVVAERLELAGRWSRVVGNSWTLGDTDHSSDELGAALTWYIRGHNLKFVVDVSHLNGSPIGSPTLNVRAGDDGWLLRSQFQLIF